MHLTDSGMNVMWFDATCESEGLTSNGVEKEDLVINEAIHGRWVRSIQCVFTDSLE